MRKKFRMTKSAVAVAMAATVALAATGCGAKSDSTTASSAETKTSQSESSNAESKDSTSANAEMPKDTSNEKDAASEENKENTEAKDNASKDNGNTSNTNQNASNSDSTSNGKNTATNPAVPTKPVAPVVAAPVQQSANATTGNTEKKASQTYTFTVRKHEPSCTTDGYDEHICNEWGGMNYNDNYVPAIGHDWDAGVVTKEATYFEKGIKTFKCKTCGETRTEEIPELDKTYHIKEVVAPTCTSEGYTVYECNEVPGLTYKGEYTNKLPHSYDDGKVTKAATIYETGIMTYTCKDCGATRTEIIPLVEKTWHKGDTIAPTCNDKGYTIYVCNQDKNLTEKRDYVDALGHDWDAGAVTKEPTCDETGVKVYTCSRDGATKTEVIPALGHDWGNGEITKAPTCTEKGVRTYTCAHDKNHTKTEDIAPLGHAWNDGEITKPATCDEDGVKTYRCTHNGCNETKTEVIPALGHDWGDGEVTKAPTCTEKGVRTYTCAHDKSHTKTEEIAALGHSYDDGVVTLEPTYESDGIKTFTCKTCGDTYTESIPAKKYTFKTTVVAPTCTTDGYTHHECNENPAKSYDDTIVPATGHAWVEHTTEATCKEEGHVDRVCTSCGASERVRDIPKTNEHKWDAGKVTVEPTCDGKGVKTFTCTVCNETKTEEIAALGHDYSAGNNFCNRCDLNSSYNQKEWEQDIFERTNALRTKNGRSELAYRSDLQDAANTRVDELLQNYIAYGDYGGKWGSPHVRPDGSGAATALGDKQDLAWGENAANDVGMFGKGHMFYLWTQSEGHLAAIMNPDANGMVCALKEYNGRVFGIQIFVRDPNYTASTQSTVNNDTPVDNAADNDAEDEPDKPEETVEYKADKANEGSLANAEAEKTSEDVVTTKNNVDTTESGNTEDSSESNDTNDAESKKSNSEDKVESGESPENVTDTDDEATTLIEDKEIYFTDDSEEDSASEDGTVEIPSETVNDTLYVASAASDKIEPALPEIVEEPIVEEPTEVIPEETIPEPEAVEPTEEEPVSEETEDVTEEVTPDVAEETAAEEPVTTDEVVAE